MRSRRNPHGSAYLAIIGASMLVAVIALSGVAALRVQLRAGSISEAADDARLYARSALELGALWVNQDPEWRQRRPNGQWVVNQPIGDGSFTLEGIDPNDGDIANWPTDPLVLRATGIRGDAQQVEQFTLVPDKAALNALELVMLAGGTFAVNGTIVSDATIGANGNFTASGALVDADVSAAGSISGSSYLRSRLTGEARTMPDASLFDQYIANATPISFSSTGGTIENVLISPSRNPYGAQTNAQGLYLIDCAGQTLRIRNCRIVGTLVILNPKSDSRITESVNMAPVVPNWPVLLVRGSFSIEMKNITLKEAGTHNYNPRDTPYDGVGNNSLGDTFPSVIRGLVYISGSLQQRETATIQGCVLVGQNISISGTVYCLHEKSHLSDPPPGFCTVPFMKLMPGSRVRGVK